MNFRREDVARPIDFWKWSLLVFLAARCGDVVQSVVGLWLMPSYLPVADIGAMLPITDGAAFLALPVSIVVVTFARGLAIYSVRDEFGRVKTLLHWMFACAGVAVGLMCTVALAFSPKFYSFVKVEERGIAGIVFAAGVLMALAPVFDGSLQGLRKFGTLALSGFLSAGFRFVVSLLIIPIRAFTGFLLGQAVAGLVRIVVSVVGLRRVFGDDLAPLPISRAEGLSMLRFAGWIAASQGIWQTVTFAQALIVRNNLSALDSATYFIAQRFGEVGQWVGLALLCVAFPVVAAYSSDKVARLRVLSRTIYVTLAAGGATAVIYSFCGKRLLDAVSIWRNYADASRLIVLFTLRSAMGCAVGAFMCCEQALGNFRYLSYLAPCVLAECVGLAFFHSLDAMLGWQLLAVSVQVLLVLAVVHFRKGRL